MIICKAAFFLYEDLYLIIKIEVWDIDDHLIVF